MKGLLAVLYSPMDLIQVMLLYLVSSYHDGKIQSSQKKKSLKRKEKPMAKFENI